ncbi:SAR1A, partial [Symbiodinium microadriaticum]
EMSDFLRTPAFAKVLRENIARYFHVPVQRQAVYDEDGLLTSNADFRRALQSKSPSCFSVKI